MGVENTPGSQEISLRLLLLLNGCGGQEAGTGGWEPLATRQPRRLQTWAGRGTHEVWGLRKRLGVGDRRLVQQKGGLGLPDERHPPDGVRGSV